MTSRPWSGRDRYQADAIVGGQEPFDLTAWADCASGASSWSATNVR